MCAGLSRPLAVIAAGVTTFTPVVPRPGRAPPKVGAVGLNIDYATACLTRHSPAPFLRMAKFIKPSEPVEASLPPTGPGIVCELKWDGYRAQLHKDGDNTYIFSRNGKHMPRFKAMLEPLARLPCHSAIIDAEFVALNMKGFPDFRALVGGQSHNLACFCFDLMMLNGKDLRPLPLTKRRASLQKLLVKADMPELQYSESHSDPEALLARLDKIGMEGIVCKVATQPYVSGRNRSWIKVKCHAWRKAEAERQRLFAKDKR